MLVFAAAVASPARALGNIAPLARASAVPEEVSAGTAVTFTAAGSVDPDVGPEPLSYIWDFGDGQVAAGEDVSHVYAAPGAYDVLLTVSDGAASGLYALTVFVTAVPTASAPRNSSPIAISGDGLRLFVANTDSGTVSIVDTVAARVLSEVSVGPAPRTVALSNGETRLFVACQASNSVWVLDAQAGSAETDVAVGHQPFGVAVVPGDGRVLVANQGSDSLSVIDPGTLTVTDVVSLGDSPRAVAVDADGRYAYVSHFLTRGDAGTVSRVDLGSLGVAPIALIEDLSPDTPSSGGGFPNLLSAITMDTSGRFVWVGGLKSNTGRGQLVSGEPLVPTNRVRGFMGPIATATGIEEPTRRLDTNDADSVSAVVLSAGDRFAFVTHQGAGRLSVFDLLKAERTSGADGSSVAFEARIDVGDAPQGIVLSPDGTRAYVHNFLSRDVAVVDVTDPRAPAIVTRIAVTSEPLPSEVVLGKRLFFSSRAPEHSQDNYIACASCHPEGGMDGRTWDFTQFGEGLRNTVDLRGRGGMAHGPVHWSANFDEIQDFENDIVHGFGGTGLAADGDPPYPPLDPRRNAGRSAALDALAEYVGSLRSGSPSPFTLPGGALSAEAQRGRAIFEDPAVGCAGCHPAPQFTDSTVTPDPADFILHDVGTLRASSGGRLGGPLSGIDTPGFAGLWDSAPYLHDGSAATLRDIFAARNPDDRHGATSALSSVEIDDLVAYLASVDSPPVDPYVPPDAGAGTLDAGSPDAGTKDAGGVDASPPPPPNVDAAEASPMTPVDSGALAESGNRVSGGGCACRVSERTAHSSGSSFFAAALLATALGLRRALRRRTS